VKSLVSWAFLPAWKLVSRRRMLALPILFLLTAVAVSAAIALNAQSYKSVLRPFHRHERASLRNVSRTPNGHHYHAAVHT
jgi:hypothetical protein